MNYCSSIAKCTSTLKIAFVLLHLHALFRLVNLSHRVNSFRCAPFLRKNLRGLCRRENLTVFLQMLNTDLFIALLEASLFFFLPKTDRYEPEETTQFVF